MVLWYVKVKSIGKTIFSLLKVRNMKQKKLEDISPRIPVESEESSHRETGLAAVLSKPWVYDLFTSLLGRGASPKSN